jgi:hypothetical protein
MIVGGKGLHGTGGGAVSAHAGGQSHGHREERRGVAIFQDKKEEVSCLEDLAP